jgi:hypothetical protein
MTEITVDSIEEMQMVVYEDRFGTLMDLGYEQGDAVALANTQIDDMSIFELIDAYKDIIRS